MGAPGCTYDTRRCRRWLRSTWVGLTGFCLMLVAQPGAAQEAPAAAAPSASAPSSSAVDAPAVNAAPPTDGQLIPPKLKHDVRPIYPKAAQEKAIAALVVLDIDIDATGRVENATVTEPAVPAGLGFDEAALAAALQLLFEPARYGEQAVPVRVSYRFRFVPDVPAAAAPPAAKVAARRSQRLPQPVARLGELAGRLQERGTRLPLVGVKVTLFRGSGAQAQGYEIETDAQGAFRFRGLSVGAWRLLADPEGYYPVRTSENVKAGERTTVAYRIERRSYNPYDVVVDTTRVQREVSHTSIDARQAERIPGTFGDVLAVVQNFPGVARTSGGLVVRGSAPEDSRVYVDNIDVPLLYHFGELRSVLPVGMIERVDFYPGNFSVRYGRATGGIVDVELKNLAPRKIGGYADISILDTSLYLEAPLSDDFAIALGARRSYIDALLNLAFSGNSESIVAPRYYDFQALASYRPSPAHQVKTFFFASDDKFEVLFDKPIGDNPDSVISDVGYAVNFYRGIAEYRYVPNKRFENELKVSFGRDTTHFNVGQQLYQNITLYQGQAREQARYQISDSLAVSAGLDYLIQYVDWSMRLPEISKEGETGGEGPEALSPSEFRYTALSDTLHASAAFTQLEIWPVKPWLLVPGLRLDHFTRTDEFALSPRLTSRYAFNRQWALKAGIGLFAQEPTFDETDAQLGNPDLGLESAVHYSAGVEYRPKPHINLELTGFYKTLHNLVSRSDALTERAGAVVPLNYDNAGQGRVIGAELSARHELSDGFFGWVAYTLSRAERKDSGSNAYRLFDHDQTHILTLIGSYQLPKNWEISSRFRYVTGDLYTPVTGAVFNADRERYEPIYGATNSGRLGGFHQLDVRIDKRWVYQSWMLNAYLDIQNVYDQPNSEGLGYNYDFSKTEKQQGLPILPVLGLRGEF